MPPPKSKFFYGYWVLMVGFFCLAIQAGLVMYPFSLYVKPLGDEFGWSRAGIMVAASLRTLGMGVFAPLVGRAIPRYGARRVIAVGALVVGLGFVLLSTVRELWQFYLFYAIVGMGTSSIGVVPATALTSSWFKKRRGRATGILGSGIGVGGFSLPLIIGVFLIPSFGWQVGFLASGLFIMLVITPLSLLIVRARPADMGLLPDGEMHGDPVSMTGNASPVSETGISLRQVLKTRAFWLIAVAFIAFGMANQAVMQNHVPHLGDMGFTAAMAASAVPAVAAGSGIGKFVFGWLCDFIKSKYTLAIGAGFGMAAMLLLINLKPTSSIFMIWLYALIFGLAVGTWLPAMSMTVSSTFGLTSYGVIFGAISFLFMIGGALGPVIAGLIYDVNQSYLWAYIMSFMLYGITLPAILLVQRVETGD